MSAMVVGEPEFRLTPYGSRQVRVTVLDDEGAGYLLSWVACAPDTGMPECMAFPYADGNVTSCAEAAVSYLSDPAEAIADVIRRLRVLVLERVEE